MTTLFEGTVRLPDKDPKYYFAVFFYLLKHASVDGSDIPEDLKPYLKKLQIKHRKEQNTNPREVAKSVL